MHQTESLKLEQSVDRCHFGSKCRTATVASNLGAPLPQTLLLSLRPMMVSNLEVLPLLLLRRLQSDAALVDQQFCSSVQQRACS